jgi:hypothetical protein
MVRNLIIFALICLGALTAFAYYAQYYVWRDCFNDLGRCYDPEFGMVYLEQAGMVWGFMTVLFFGIALFLARYKFKK